MAVVRCTAVADSATTVTTLGLTLPTSPAPVAGDIGYLIYSYNDSTARALSSGLAGWTAVQAATAYNNMTVAIYRRTFVAGDGNLSLTWATAAQFAIMAFWVDGSQVSGIDVTGAIGSRGGVTSTTITAPAITTVRAEPVVSIFVERGPSTGTTFSVGAGTVVRYVENLGTTSHAVTEQVAGPSVPAVVGTYSGTGSGNGMGLSIGFTAPATLALTANAASTGTGQGALTTQLVLAANGASTATGQAALAERMALAANGASTATGQAALTLAAGSVAHQLVANGASSSAGQADLVATLRMAANATRTGTGQAVLGQVLGLTATATTAGTGSAALTVVLARPSGVFTRASASLPPTPPPQGVITGVRAVVSVPRPQGVFTGIGVSTPPAPRAQGVVTRAVASVPAGPRPQGVITRVLAVSTVPRPSGVFTRLTASVPPPPTAQGVITAVRVTLPPPARPRGVVTGVRVDTHSAVPRGVITGFIVTTATPPLPFFVRRTWNGSRWVYLPYKYWTSTDWVLAPSPSP